MPKRHIVREVLFTSQAMGGDFTSNTIDPEDFFTIKLRFSWAGADAGTAQLFFEESDDGVEWERVPSNSSYTIDNLETNQGFVYQYINFKYLRVRYVANTVTTGLISCSYRLYNERD